MPPLPVSLSIAIPTFDYLEGFVCILQQLNSSPFSGIELIVADDSLSDSIRDYCASIGGSCSFSVRYLAPDRSRSSHIDNWNRALESCSNDYILLLHHDDAPESPDFLSLLYSEIVSSNYPDAIYLEPMLRAGRSICIYPGWARAFYMYCIKYTGPLRYNLLGPPSVFVCRRACYPRYRKDLVYLVDIELFYRSSRLPRIIFSSIGIVATSSRPEQITNQLKSAGLVRRQVQNELTIIRSPRVDSFACSILTFAVAVVIAINKLRLRFCSQLLNWPR